MPRGIFFRDSSAQRTIVGVWHRDASAQRNIIAAWHHDGTAQRQFWPINTIALSNRTISAFINVAGTATSTLTLASTGEAIGSVTPSGSGDGNYSPQWGVGTTTSNYEARWTTTAGALSSGTAGTWLNLGTSRAWAVSRGAPGSSSCTGTLEIRDTVTGIVVATATITLYAERIV
jgi:hypothetical protein